jgi:hypothetical protein
MRQAMGASEQRCPQGLRTHTNSTNNNAPESRTDIKMDA